MQLLSDRILTLNLIATTIVFYVAARIYLLPNLARLSPRQVLIPILLLHSLRHLGLMFLTRGATYRCSRFHRHLRGRTQLAPRATAGLALQCRWKYRFTRRDHARDHL